MVSGLVSKRSVLWNDSLKTHFLCFIRIFLEDAFFIAFLNKYFYPERVVLMAVTMQDLFSKRDVVEDCRHQIKVVKNHHKFRITAELVLKDGERRIFRAKSVDKNAAIREVLTFVSAVERATGDKVMWRLKGDKTYYLSTNYTAKDSFFERSKKAFLSYFFEIN